MAVSLQKKVFFFISFFFLASALDLLPVEITTHCISLSNSCRQYQCKQMSNWKWKICKVWKLPFSVSTLPTPDFAFISLSFSRLVLLSSYSVHELIRVSLWTTDAWEHRVEFMKRRQSATLMYITNIGFVKGFFFLFLQKWKIQTNFYLSKYHIFRLFSFIQSSAYAIFIFVIFFSLSVCSSSSFFLASSHSNKLLNSLYEISFGMKHERKKTWRKWATEKKVFQDFYIFCIFLHSVGECQSDCMFIYLSAIVWWWRIKRAMSSSTWDEDDSHFFRVFVGYHIFWVRNVLFFSEIVSLKSISFLRVSL